MLEAARTYVKESLRRRVRAAGWEVRRLSPIPPLADFETELGAIVQDVRPFSMTSPERLYTACKAAEHVVEFGIPGAIVECGVWRGGTMMAMARSLMLKGDTSRDLYLFDTYAGMTKPTDVDRSVRGGAALPAWLERSRGTHNEWDYAPLDDVRRNLASTDYPMEHCTFVVGDVCETVPARAPDDIAVLRLDTDWYESTKHELRYLFPRLQSGGVLIVDDYGHWQGARMAVDEYIRETGTPLFLARVDYTGRVAVKP